MPIYAAIYRRLAALLLPAALLWSWMACVSICTEISEHDVEKIIVNTPGDCSNICNQDSCSDGCQLTVMPAKIQERQTIQDSVAAAAEVSFSTFKPTLAPASIAESDVKQNSPPLNHQIPIFLRFRNFRI